MNPNIRKLPGVTSDKSIITESHNLQKSLARKKKARHVPLRSAAAKTGVKPTPVDMAENVTTPFTPVDTPSQHLPTFATVHEVSDDSSEGTDLPELVSPQSPTSSESSLQSLDGFSSDFAFTPPQYVPAPTEDWKAPGMFKMPATPASCNELVPTFSATAGLVQPLRSRHLDPSLSLRRTLVRHRVAQISRLDSILQPQCGLQLPILKPHLLTTRSRRSRVLKPSKTARQSRTP